MAFVGAVLGVAADELVEVTTEEEDEEACVEELDCAVLDVFEEVLDDEALEEQAGSMLMIAASAHVSRRIVFFIVFLSCRFRSISMIDLVE